MVFVAYRCFLSSKHLITQAYPKGYLPLSSFSKYTTSDGKNIVYEVFRHIQIKWPVLQKIEHRFEWTGTQEPRVQSDLQNSGAISPINGTRLKSLLLNFKHPKIYNSVEVIHFKMEIDDSDQASKPFLCQKVENPIYLISFRVELLNAQTTYFLEKAKFTRQNIANGSSAIEENLATISFDSATKSYFHQVPNPEPGYTYKLSWTRPPII